MMKHDVKLSESDGVVHLPFAFCIVCGLQTNVKSYKFEETENSPVAQFAKLAGGVSIIAEHVLNKPHSVIAPFCTSCIGRFRGVFKRQQISVLVGLVALLVSFVLSIVVSQYVGIGWSSIPFAIGILLFVASRVYARFYAWKNSPNIVILNERQIVLKIPGRGKFVCQR